MVATAAGWSQLRHWMLSRSSQLLGYVWLAALGGALLLSAQYAYQRSLSVEEYAFGLYDVLAADPTFVPQWESLTRCQVSDREALRPFGGSECATMVGRSRATTDRMRGGPRTDLETPWKREGAVGGRRSPFRSVAAGGGSR